MCNRPVKTLTEQEWEGLCRRCGRCCFEKWVDEDGTIHDTAIPCRYLDIVTRACKVYHQRLHVGEGCVQLTPQTVANLEWLPADCGYNIHLGLTGNSTLRTGASHAPFDSSPSAADLSAPRRNRRRRRHRDG